MDKYILVGRKNPRLPYKIQFNEMLNQIILFHLNAEQVQVKCRWILDEQMQC